MRCYLIHGRLNLSILSHDPSISLGPSILMDKEKHCGKRVIFRLVLWVNSNYQEIILISLPSVKWISSKTFPTKLHLPIRRVMDRTISSTRKFTIGHPNFLCKLNGLHHSNHKSSVLTIRSLDNPYTDQWCKLFTILTYSMFKICAEVLKVL